MSSDKASCAVIRRIFTNQAGYLRAIWQFLLILICWHALSFAAAYLLSRFIYGLFESWGITGANISLAPGWVRFIAAYQAQLISSVPAIISAFAAVYAMRFYRDDCRRPTSAKALYAAAGFPAGIAASIILMCIFLVCDSMRVTSTSPDMTPDIVLMLPFSIIAAAAECCVAFGYVRTMASRHAGRIAGHIIAAAAFCLMNLLGFGTVLSAVNSLLIALVLSVVSERFGLAACIALRGGWLWAISSISGFPDSVHGMYTMYPVSENALTGGFNGPESGLAVTIICLAICVFTLMIPEIKKRKNA